MKLNLFTAQTAGDARNCFYPNQAEVSNAQEFQDAVRMDHVCAEYLDHRRSNTNFLESNVIVMDCDNDHTDNPDEWITPEKLDEMMPDISYVIAFSRHHMLEKNGKAARPKFHVYFEIDPTQDVDYYVGLKRGIFNRYPFFDGNALDAARFIFGSDAGGVIWHPGEKTIDHFDQVTVSETTVKPVTARKTVSLTDENPAVPGGLIIAGERNSAMYHFATVVLKRFGDTENARLFFHEKAAFCKPLLDYKELSSIWDSAVKWYEDVVCKAEGYVPPDQYNTNALQDLLPTDHSDIGEAKVLVSVYGDWIRYSEGTDFLVYDGIYWHESKQMAVGAMADLLDMQLIAANYQLETIKQSLISNGVPKEVVETGGKVLRAAVGSGDLKQVLTAYLEVTDFYKFIVKHRDHKYVSSTLQQAKPYLHLDINRMDANPFLLNTPIATYDLRKGLAGKQKHNWSDYLTKCTIAAPGDDGKKLWMDTVNQVFCGDQDLINYVQTIVGMAAIGQVFSEALIIAYGSGRNGKSTFWNAISRVLGSYSGMLSSDVLTASCRRNARPEVAELKGKRLIITAELEEGMRLDTGMIKQLCSTDEIEAEKKYHDPFKFLPSHTVVLYTNHLPKVSANDDGTWRRLIVIPFLAKIQGSSEIKNYADYLVKNAAPYIMTWIIEGAKMAYEADFNPKLPLCVQKAIDEYKEENDWLAHFLEECCEVGEGLEQHSSPLYRAYRDYSARSGDYVRRSNDFKAALEKAGFRYQRTRAGSMFFGLKLKNDLVSAEPF